MKRSVLLIALVSGFVATLALGQAPSAEVSGPQVTPAPRQVRRPMERRLDPQQQLQELQSQFKTLEAEHRELMEDLKAVKAQAQEEKATQTLKAVNDLMEKLESEHQPKARSMKNRIRRIQRIVASMEQRQMDINRVGITAPNFALKDLGGNELRLDQFKGKIVVLEWISPTSGAVLYHHEKKTLTGLRDKVRQEGVVWLDLVSGTADTDKDLKRFVERYGIDWPVLDDRKGKIVSRAYGITHAPQIVIVNAEGKIAYIGAIDNDPRLGKLKKNERINYVAQALEALLAGQPVATPKSEVYGDAIQ